MEGNDELQKKARPGEMAIKGTRQPDVTTEPVAPAQPVDGFGLRQAPAREPGDDEPEPGPNED